MTTMLGRHLCFAITLFVYTSAQTGNEIGLPRCPQACTCSRYLKRISCIGKGLTEIPSEIPRTATELYLSNNLLTALPRLAFDGLSNLTTLSLKQNRISSIDDDAFLGLTALKVLFLTNNRLGNLSAETFRSLTSLNDLYLTQNELETIPDLKYASSLVKLAIDTNKLRSAAFQQGFENLTSLNSVGVANNPTLLEVCDEDFRFRPPNVRIINLSRCGLKKLGQKVFRFAHLQSLILSYNPWWNVTFAQTIIDSLADCRELESLDLSGTIQGAELPSDFFKSLLSVPLKNLNLANMAVDVINGSMFSYLRQLAKLDLRNGKLTTLIGSLSSIPALQRLVLAENKNLASVPNLELPSLTFLDLRGCAGVSMLTQGMFSKVPNLESLLMSDCGVIKVQKNALIGLTKVKNLDLSGNAIGGSSLPVKLFSSLSNLRSLDLSRNNMKIILQESELFKGLIHLELLNLSDNECSVLPPGIFNTLVSLRQLDLSNNNLGDSVISSSSGNQLFTHLKAVESVNLASNAIDALPSRLFDQTSSLRAAVLAGNRLTSWSSAMFNSTTGGNLTTIDLSSNRISIVTQSMIEGLPWSNDLGINLTGNPFACWCDLVWFRRWITDDVNVTEQRLLGLSEYKCNSPASMTGRPLIAFDWKSIETVCRPPPWMLISIVVPLVSVIVIVASVSVAYRYRWRLRLRFYYIGKRLRRNRMRNGYQSIDGHEEETQYDVLVSYCSEGDSGGWVRSFLYPALSTAARTNASLNADEVARGSGFENDEDDDDPGRFISGEYRVFCEEIDVAPGGSVIGAIADAMSCSNKVLIVAGDDCVANRRFQFEIEMAVERGLNRVILVLWGGESVGPKLPRLLHPLLNHRTLVWTPDDRDGQELFWEKLDEELTRSVDNEEI